GMCESSVAAYAELIDTPLTSAAVMVPCPWFPAAAKLIREKADHPNLDVGVHLTITSEWDLMRWGPLTHTAVSRTLLDEEGYFCRQSEPVQAKADATAVSAEINAQIETAIKAGIQPTHIDSHMGTLFHTNFLPLYIQASAQFQLPFLALRRSKEQYVEMGYDENTAVMLSTASQQLEQQGTTLFDSVQMMPLHEMYDYAARLKHASHILNNLPAGLHYFIVHPTTDSPEIRTLTASWPARVGDYQLFLDEKWATAISKSGVKPIGMKPLKDLLHAQLGS
ncbi:MAG: polysaccharide deacetylase family protein, partial [Chloroflexota bacterium]